MGFGSAGALSARNEMATCSMPLCCTLLLKVLLLHCTPPFLAHPPSCLKTMLRHTHYA